MKNYYQNSLKFKVLSRIEQLPGNVVLRQDIQDMASPRQISRCFKDLIDMNKLVKIGQGVYAKARPSEYTSGSVIIGGFDQACKEALTKLGIKWEPGTAEQEYNSGLSTQIPVRTIVKLKSRFRRPFNYDKTKLIVEKGINAR